MLSEFREWIVPLIAVGSLVWQCVTMLRRNVVRPEDLKPYATTDNLLSVEKLLQDQIDTTDKAVVEVGHDIELLQKDVGNLPSHGTVQELRNAVSDLGGAIRELKAELKAVDEKVGDQAIVSRRIEHHLLNQAG